MVKLRVAARVIRETAYNDAQSTATAGRKFLVVVRNPEDWYIGTLAVEIQNTYKRIYKHDLGQIKYLKDAEDFDLDPEQCVADLFVNEGKAERDGLDQEATIKVIQEQGQALRYDSVVPDLTPVHYQRRPLPPVPKFNDVPPTLGKRSHDLTNGRTNPDHGYGGKRLRQAEIEPTQERDHPIPSVERSPELIEDTQTSEIRYARPDELPKSNLKLESPELRRSSHDIAPATADELELLPEAPLDFPRDRRGRILGGEHVTPRANGGLQNAARRSSASNQRSHLPITPPTDPAIADPSTKSSAANGRHYNSRSPGPQASSAISKFKSARQDLYDFQESDIEDSQMSPRAKDPLPVPRLVKKMSSIEKMLSQQQNSYSTFNAQEALDPMDLDDDANTTNAFIAEKRHSVSLHNDFGDRRPKTAPARRDASDDEMEILATASEHKQATESQKSNEPSQSSTSTIGKTKPTKPDSSVPAAPVAKGTEGRPKSAGTESSRNQAGTESMTATPKKKKKRKRQKRKDSLSETASQAPAGVARKPGDSEPSTGKEMDGSSSKVFAEAKQRRRPSDLDSPGEQLSQSLQESARKGSLSEVNQRLANSEQNGDSRPSTSGSTSTSTSRRSSSSKTGSSPSRLGLGITNSPRKNKDRKDDKQGTKGGGRTLMEKFEKAKESATPRKKKAPKTPKLAIDAEDTALPPVKAAAREPKPIPSIDVDNHCAVVVGDKGPCKSNLACKSHSMVAKRAVQGRSKPYDTLLKVYQTQRSAQAEKPLPNWGSGGDDKTIKKASGAPEQARTAVKPGSSKPIRPIGMTEAEYARLIKENEEKGVVEKPMKKNATKEKAKASTSVPGIKVTVSEKSSSTSQDTDSIESSVEQQKDGVKEKKSKSKTPPGKPLTKTNKTIKTPTPAANIRESTTPGSDFEAITANLLAMKPNSVRSDPWRLQPSAQRPTLKKQESKDRRSSAASSEIPKSESKNTMLSVASSSTSEPNKPAKADTSTNKPPPAKTTPKPTAVGKSSTPSISQKATLTPKSAAPVSSLKELKARLAEESREASKNSSPVPTTAKGVSIANQGRKKVFESNDESSPSDSDSDSDDSSDDSSDGGKDMKRSSAKTSASAIPDKSIRDPTPDDESSEED